MEPPSRDWTGSSGTVEPGGESGREGGWEGRAKRATEGDRKGRGEKKVDGLE